MNIYFLVVQKNPYISEICYKFILTYIPFATFIVIYLYCSAVNRASVKILDRIMGPKLHIYNRASATPILTAAT